MRPKISVCMATYNGGRYIREQLNSILMQLSPMDEVIISDDRSTDDTLAVIASFADPRIKVYVHEEIENQFKGAYINIYNVYKNVQNALMYAIGEYIFLSDQDDIWLPDKVERVMQEFDNGAECILHNNKVIDNNHNTLLESYFTFSNPSENWIRFITKCFYQGASMAFTARIKDLALPMPKNPISHDHWIACVAWTHGKKISFIQEQLLLYRRHGNNVSPSSEKSPNSLWFKISYRFRLLWAYFKSSQR